jgi:argininosuccinate lyase
VSAEGRFHQIYRDTVLHPDFRFARQHLWEHFLDAMTAHVMTVRTLDEPHIRAHDDDIGRLLAAIAGLRSEPLPEYAPDVPDLYFAFNSRLEAALGREPVSFLRLGLSRNDLDMTVYKMRTRELLLVILEHLNRLRGALQEQAEEHLETIHIAQTHHQPGQPTTVAHYLTAIDHALARDSDRLLEGYDRLNRCPLGAAALAGSSHPLDRELTARLLGFDGPVANTYDAVAAADWQVEFMGCIQNVALNLSRFVCDLITWASDGRFHLPDTLVQGSSIMPQKRNPVALEHARTRLSRTLGSAQMVLYSSHNIPYADLNDFGPDIQGALVSTFIQIDGALSLVAVALEEGRFDKRKLSEIARCTDTTATELADILTRHHGMSFQDAHGLAGALVLKLCQEGRELQEATPDDVIALGGPLVEAEALRDALDPWVFVTRRAGIGGPAPKAMCRLLDATRSHRSTAVDRLAEVQTTLTEARAYLAAPGREHG